MAVYSSTLRYTGTSGIDTESMVRALMSAESMKYDNLKAQTQKIEWKQEAYRNIADKLKSFQSSFLDIVSAGSLRSSGTFSNLASTIKSSNGTVSSQISVKTSANTTVGKHTITVNQLADKDVYVSDKIVSGGITSEKKAGGILTGLTDAANDASGNNPSKSVSFRLNIDGVIKDITLSEDEIKNKIGATNDATTQTQLLNLLNDKIKAAFGTIDDGSGKGKVEFTFENINKGNYLKLVSKEAGHSVAMSLPTNGNANFLEIMGMSDTGHVQFEDITEMNLGEALGFSNFGSDGKATITINGEAIEIDTNTTVNAFMGDVNKIDGVKLSYDRFKEGFSLESTATGASGKINWDLSDGSASKDLFTALGFAGTNSHVSEAQDAVFVYNGTTTSRSTNSFTLSNMTISLDDASAAGETFTIEIKKDTQATLETVKKFVEAYNTLIGDMNGMINQKRSKKDTYNYYEPLTEDQKAEMTESQIEKWETKAKEGILYRDDIINGITSSMRSWLYEEVKLDNGKTISLYEIGITTSSKSADQGKLIINEEKLADALTNRLEDIKTLFTRGSDYLYSDKKNRNSRMKEEGLAERLNDLINDAISGTGTISQKAGIKGSLSEFTNDLYYKLKDHSENLARMLTYLTNKETNYYNMFSKMEAAMTSANAQAAYLASQLG